jgi:serine/threonine protein kinase
MKSLKGFKRVTDIDLYYEKKESLETGAFGSVFTAVHRLTGTLCAVKIIKKDRVREREVLTELMGNEISVLEEVSHPNIMRIFELMEDKSNYFIVTEFVRGGNLMDKLKKEGSLSESTTRTLIKQILMAMTYMHETKKISHRDIKLENVLLDKGDVVKLTDFGFASHFQPNE